MELKNKKNKSKRVLTKTQNLMQEVELTVEVPIIEVPEEIEVALQDKNNGIVFLEEVETQDNLSDLPESNPKKFFKIDYKNMLENKKKLFLTYIPLALLVVFLISSFYLWSQLSDIKKDPLKAANAETMETIAAVGKIMVLPADETPKIATLTDADLSKIKTQSFFINANVGDKVLVYSIARKVILYSPKINKIIEVANLNSDTGPSASPSL